MTSTYRKAVPERELQRRRWKTQDFVIGASALAMAFLIGLVAGYKIEQHRVRSHRATPAAGANAPGGTAAGGAHRNFFGATRVSGDVTASSANSLTIKTSTNSQKFTITSATIIDKAAVGTSSDITS